MQPLTVDEFIKQIAQSRNGRDIGHAKSLVLCARSLFPNDLLLMNQHYEVLVQEANYASAARVVATLFEKNPQHELFVLLFLQILSSHLPSSPLFPPTAARIKELLTSFKQQHKEPQSSTLSSSHLPPTHRGESEVLAFFDLEAKEKMVTSCCSERKEYSIACLLYSLLISWQAPKQFSTYWNQAAELALACEKQQNLPIFNPFREFLAKIVAVSPSSSKTYLQAIQYHLAKCNWTELAQLFSHLVPTPSTPSTPSTPTLALGERLAKDGWTHDACVQCAASMRENLTAGAARADELPVVLALAVCVLVRNLWGYYRIIAGVGEGVEGGLEGSADNPPFVLIYDFGDEVQEVIAEERSTKKKRLNDSEWNSQNPDIGTYPQLGLAMEIWNLLSHAAALPSFTALWTEWGYSDKVWIQLALGDMFMHDKRTAQARDILTKVETILNVRTFHAAQAHTTTPLDAQFVRKLETQHDMWIDRTRLQTAMCHMCESALQQERGEAEAHVKRAAVKMLEVLVDRPFPSDSAFLPLSTPSSTPSLSPRAPSVRADASMPPCFVPLSENEVLLRCVSGLVWCYMKMGQQKMGNVLVLLQANWTRYAQAFSRIANTVLSGSGLSYDSFFDYVVKIAFLENSGAPLQLHGTAAFLKNCETLHDMLEVHLQASSTSDNMSIPAILPRFAAAEMLKLCS